MPFFQSPKTGRPKRKSRAYLPAAYRDLDFLPSGTPEQRGPELTKRPTSPGNKTPVNMGRRTQKPGPSAEHSDIGAMLQRQAPPKMATAEAPVTPSPPHAGAHPPNQPRPDPIAITGDTR
ncbi:Hypothetical predicted protein [Pelobates cultripes]|uniref:Uncharacterized protein n=1 Tax=Pelobates cultripes TaxID=61616 RepID=A0AAD1WDW4_PELCU|nr:Hypothetical predicted protein [Pelobates cultripes]